MAFVYTDNPHDHKFLAVPFDTCELSYLRSVQSPYSIITRAQPFTPANVKVHGVFLWKN